MGRRITEFAVNHPKLVLALALLVTALSLTRVGTIRVDTDPENMLSEEARVRVFHHQVKAAFALSDMVVVGVVNEVDPDGVFNPATLGAVHRLTQGIRGIAGVVLQDLMAPGTVDDILQAGPGTVRFQYLMERPPETREEARHIRDRALANPLLDGTLVSEDGKALALYVPIQEKSIAHRVSQEIQALIATAGGDSADQFHITGLPVAEDTFGVEMFKQMAISAPLAGLIVFLLMLFFFRKLTLVIAPMVVAMLTVAITMGTLIGTGNTVHIMSSMIPIFLMPIAVVDSVHIISVFFDRYQEFQDRKKTLRVVMTDLFTPMLYTSVTTLAGFASLALTPIPPVRVFGLFVAFGVAVAWVLTVLLVPAYILVFIPERRLKDFGTAASHAEDADHSPLARGLIWLGRITTAHARTWIALTAAVLAVSVYGISRIQINDNPVKWFEPGHPIRVADQVLNHHFGGTYEAYLVLEPPVALGSARAALAGVQGFLEGSAAGDGPVPAMAGKLRAHLDDLTGALPADAGPEAPVTVVEALAKQLDHLSATLSQDDAAAWEAFDALSEGLEDQRTALHLFKDPALLRWVATFQRHLAEHGIVGKTNGLPDVVKKVHQELYEGKEEQFRIPDTAAAVAQCLLSFQGSHDPDDVWHLVTPDYRRINLWFQLKSGDNRDMEGVVKTVEEYLVMNPPPVELQHEWAGLTYLNVVWQEKMVKGMLSSLLGSFAMVLVIMIFLFRSVPWGLLSMVPLSVTIAFIYGLIGLIGKDYDMPVAVLSSLTLGMSIDFAIHYIERSRELVRETGSWREASRIMAHAPARAITRNAIVIALGFLPLLLATLIPYQTVGLFLATIMAVSGFGTLVILPALVQLFQNTLFRKDMAQHNAAA
ncbi:MAG: MMPL family transporter [Deferrisomatales bacterium]|nr:MMPL family transporter [Deferrisomatales bacterium]